MTPAQQDSAAARRALNVASFIAFSGAIFFRALDPVILQIAGDFAVKPETAALLAAAFAIPYGFIQPILGPVADMIGKPRVMTIGVGVIVATAVASAFAPSFGALFVMRILAGAACGGAFPIAMALVGDLVPVERRQVALGRLLFATITGTLLGSAVAGVVADNLHWRAIFIVYGAVGMLALATAIIGFRNLPPIPRQPFNLAVLPARFGAIFASRNARICYSAVALEGIFLFGVFPYVAILLHAAGEDRAAIAGIVIGGFAAGGVIYAGTVRWTLAWFGQRGLMQIGGSAIAFGLVALAWAPPWPVQCFLFVVIGVGFYMLHGSILVFVTELAPAMRSSGVAFHSFSFFGGQGVGPVVFGAGLTLLGAATSLTISATVLLAIGFVGAVLLTRPPRPAGPAS
jgi:predicted MFS family arabinose efflux permease